MSERNPDPELDRLETWHEIVSQVGKDRDILCRQHSARLGEVIDATRHEA